jgi:hypothetical protein
MMTCSVENAKRLHELGAWQGREWEEYDLTLSISDTPILLTRPSCVQMNDGSWPHYKPTFLPTLGDLLRRLEAEGFYPCLRLTPYEKWYCNAPEKQYRWPYANGEADTPEDSVALTLIQAMEAKRDGD